MPRYRIPKGTIVELYHDSPTFESRVFDGWRITDREVIFDEIDLRKRQWLSGENAQFFTFELPESVKLHGSFRSYMGVRDDEDTRNLTKWENKEISIRYIGLRETRLEII